jgi:hypothetical protein
MCKPLHNFFHGCPTNRQFKAKLDGLIKERPSDTVQHLVEEAIRDIIPDAFLAERPGGAMIEEEGAL